jgi:nucleoside-diphosphate-sugar epimerase
MRVFVAGASGAVGTRLVPQLVERGHEVIGTSRSAGKAQHLRALGAEPVALDLLDRAAVRRAVLEAAPDAVVHEATALSEVTFSRNFDRTFAHTNRLRTEGTDALLAAAREAKADRSGDPVVVMATEARGASNAKAKRELGFKPRHPSWRQGFAAAYAPAERGNPDRAARTRT